MGNWQLEIAKMAVYVTFPVAMFHYFNQPALFEDWVIRKKRELYPPEDKEIRKKFEESIKEWRQEHEKF